MNFSETYYNDKLKVIKLVYFVQLERETCYDSHTKRIYIWLSEELPECCEESALYQQMFLTKAIRIRTEFRRKKLWKRIHIPLRKIRRKKD